MSLPDEAKPAAGPPKDFYVGYTKLPKRHLVLLILLLPVFAGVVFGGAYLVGSGQPPAGTGRWDDATVVTHRGTVRFEPYPVLVKYDEDGRATSYLLVNEAKLGVVDLLEGYDGQITQLKATQIERDNQRMLEIAGGKDGIGNPSPALEAEVALDSIELGELTLVGEVIDPKCYFGAMKPGEGAAHRPCAMLCLLGGVPPMLAAEHPDGRRRYYLLTDPAGDRIEEETLDALLPFVGVPVRVTGQASRLGDMLRLAIDVETGLERVGG